MTSGRIGSAYAAATPDGRRGRPRLASRRSNWGFAVSSATRDGGANLTHTGPAAEDTADFADGAPGNLRADYVLPSKRLTVRDTGVYWLTSADPLFTRLVGTFPFPASDHRLVWVDLRTGRTHGR